MNFVKYNAIKTIVNASTPISSILLMNDGRIAYTADYNEINIVYMNENFNCDLQIPLNEAITCIAQLDNNRIVVSLKNFSIKIYSIAKKTYNIAHSIDKAHPKMILKVIGLTNNRIASCSDDHTIKIWSALSPYNLLSTLIGHFHSPQAIIQIKNKELLMSGSFDATLRLWSLISYQCLTIRSYVICTACNSLIQINEKQIAIGSFGCCLIIDIDSMRLIELIKISDEPKGIHAVNVIDESCILFSFDHEMYLYDMKNKTYSKYKEDLHKKDISSIVKIGEKMIVTGSYDKSIRVIEV